MIQNINLRATRLIGGGVKIGVVSRDLILGVTINLLWKGKLFSTSSINSRVNDNRNSEIIRVQRDEFLSPQDIIDYIWDKFESLQEDYNMLSHDRFNEEQELRLDGYIDTLRENLTNIVRSISAWPDMMDNARMNLAIAERKIAECELNLSGLISDSESSDVEESVQQESVEESVQQDVEPTTEQNVEQNFQSNVENTVATNIPSSKKRKRDDSDYDSDNEDTKVIKKGKFDNNDDDNDDNSKGGPSSSFGTGGTSSGSNHSNTGGGTFSASITIPVNNTSESGILLFFNEFLFGSIQNRNNHVSPVDYVIQLEDTNPIDFIDFE